MIFSELYSAYYNVVAKILESAVDHPLQKNEIRQIIEKHAFAESVLNIEPAITEERWQLVRKDGTTPIEHVPTMPMTTLQKRWLKAVFQDPRIKLFTDETIDLPDVEPLFRQEDIVVFDKYADGDPYENPTYIKHFRLILNAIKNRYPLRFNVENRNGSPMYIVMIPEKLEYSEKDDKFRVAGSGTKDNNRLNLGRIISCRTYDKPYEQNIKTRQRSTTRQIIFELINERNALDRVLMHFAHFEKEVEKADENKYIVKVTYDKDDEIEMVIRILSFGPMVKVTSPQHFIDLIKERLIMQKSCGL